MYLSVASLVLIIFGAWFWYDSLRAKELATNAGKEHCAEHGLQLLDDTAALRHIRLSRSFSGSVCFLRVYAFDYLDQYNLKGTETITIRGHEVDNIELPIPNNVVDFVAFRAAHHHTPQD